MTQLYVLLVILVVLPSHLDGSPCCGDWSNYAVGNKCYKLFNSRKSWDEAKTACNQVQAKLAELKDFNTTHFIRANFSAKAWVGAHRCGGGITCFLNNSYIPYTPYSSDEPNMKSDQQSTNQTSADLKENDFAILIQTDGSWADELKDNRYPYICEMPADLTVLVNSCASLYKFGERKNGVYCIDPDGLGSFQVFCDMETDGGGWTVFQRRLDESEDFYRRWSDYKAGFGDLNGNFWLGLDKIHRLTKSGQNVLRVDLMDFDNTTAYAQYGIFSVANENESYKLEISKYSGNAGNSFSGHNEMKFSTKDRDNDRWPYACTLDRRGAWWYNACAYSNLNGRYLKEGDRSLRGISWYFWKKDYRSMKNADMKLRPVN